MINIKDLKEIISQAPSETGVYIFKDSEGRVLYVGKARSLKARLRSYLNERHLTPKMRHMLGRAAKLEWYLAASELEAFILESNLIKRFRPPFNVLLKDDKRYPYIRFDIKDPYPYLQFVRRVKDDGALYYGPYVPAWAVRETLSLLSRAFPMRRCSGPLRKRPRPCLNHQMGRCLAPCSQQIDPMAYGEMVHQVRQVLEGKGKKTLESLEKEMEKLSEELRFEEAARTRDQIFALKRVMERQRVLLKEEKDLDFILWKKEGRRFYLFLLMVRRGMVLGEKGFTLEGEEGVPIFFREFYGTGLEIPPLVVLVPSIPEKTILQEWLTLLKGAKVKITQGQGEEKLLLSLAQEKLASYIEDVKVQARNRRVLLEKICQLLALPSLPIRIEAYDISDLSGREAVGSMVTFVEGEPWKEGYRHFTIRTGGGSDDYAMMREMISRRLEHLEWEPPQLMIIDGGKGHLEAVLEILREKGVTGIEARALAKERKERPERVYFPSRKEPVYLEPSSPVTHLVQRIRDEAHRFAVTHHRKVRRKTRFTSLLEQIPGVGASKRRRLLEAFGSLDTLAQASLEEIASIKGITPALAAQIKDFLEGSLKR